MSEKGLQKGTILPYMDTKPTIDETAFIAQGVRVIGDVTIKEGANIWYNTVLRGDEHPIVIGKYTNVQDNSTLHIMHDWPCIVGDYVTVGHGAIVHGCTIGDNCLIGMGAVVLSYAEVGENSIIAAGSVVTERAKIPPRSMVMGIPGKVVRQITDEEVEMLRKSALDYHALAQRYKE